MSLVNLIAEEIASDDCDQSERLRSVYEQATPEQRTAINDAFTCLCGWGLDTLMMRDNGTDDEIEDAEDRGWGTIGEPS